MSLIGLVILSGFSCRRRLHSVAMPYKLGRKEGVGSFPEVQLKPSVLLKTLDLHLVAEQESCHLLDHVCLGRGGSLPSRLMVVPWCLPGGLRPVFATDFAFALPFPLSGLFCTGAAAAMDAAEGTEDSVLAKNAPCELRGTDAINGLNIDFSMSLVH